jgi:hypothetical protein
MQTINITAYTEDASQIEAIKAVMKALKIKFEISKGKTYHPKFVEKIERSRQDLVDGKGTVVTLEELNDLWK